MTKVVDMTHAHLPFESFDTGHDLSDADLFKFFLNVDELAESSPDSSQSATVSSPESSEFESPPTSPPCHNFDVEVKREHKLPVTMAKLQEFYEINAAPFCGVPIKEEHVDYLSQIKTEAVHSSYTAEVPVLATDLNSKKRRSSSNLINQTLETYAQTLAASRPLTVDEERQLKRQRRLIKNRESAQLSRQRKRIYIEDLERKVNLLTADNDELTKKVSNLTSENQSLKEEMLYLQNIIKQSPVLSNMVALGKKNAVVPPKECTKTIKVPTMTDLTKKSKEISECPSSNSISPLPLSPASPLSPLRPDSPMSL